MSEEQLAAFMAALKADAALQEKLKGAEDLDAAVAIAKDAGFDISKAEIPWTDQTLELTDEELEGAAGGFIERDTAWVCLDERIANLEERITNNAWRVEMN